MPIIEAAARFTRPSAPDPNHYVEHLRSGDLAVGTYSIPAGAPDHQTPHTADEVYVVTSGHATFTETDGQTHSYPVGPGTTIYVRAGGGASLRRGHRGPRPRRGLRAAPAPRTAIMS